MNKKEIIDKTKEYVKQTLAGQSGDHDWWHIYRVWKLAQTIGEKENADSFVVQLAALLHDIADWKFHGGDTTIGPKKAREWLESIHVEQETIVHVCDIIKNMSFKGAGVQDSMKTKEGMIVQDADRLDALGAIGIARAFSYGGKKNRELYNPTINPESHKTFEQYKTSVGTTINHFYEKLLLLKSRMHTQTAKRIAEERHKFMEEFLKRFFEEWEMVR